MLSIRVRSLLAGLGLVVLGTSPAWAQSDPKVALTGGVDVTNQYNFRGIRQNTEGAAFWPWVDVGIPAFSGDGGLKGVTINLGTWNSLHTQLADSKWYESDLYATVGFAFSKAALALNYTSYTSPGDYFAHVKEFGIKLAVDDSSALGKGALKPYALVAFELTDDGQADAGESKGTYIELGVAPGYTGAKASLAVPIKVGLSGKDYYEFGTGSDSTFGYFSIAGIVTVPMGAHWNVHGGGEYQVFGDNVRTYNGFGDDGLRRGAGIATFGIGFSY
jgi:hypothetical protein